MICRTLILPTIVVEPIIGDLDRISKFIKKPANAILVDGFIAVVHMPHFNFLRLRLLIIFRCWLVFPELTVDRV